MGVAAHPLAQVTHHKEASVVGLAGLGGVQARPAGGGKVHTGLILDRIAIPEHAHAAGVFHEQVKGGPGSLHRHQAAQQTGGLTGLALGRIGVPAVDSTQRVAAQVPYGSTVGGDGIPHAGQLRHHRGQVAQRAAGGGHDDHAPVGGGLQGGPGTGRDLPFVVQQGAVQVQGGKAYRGKRLRHKNSFYQQGTPAFWAGVRQNRVLFLFYNTGRVCASGRNVL